MPDEKPSHESKSGLWQRVSLRWKLTFWVIAVFTFIQGTLIVVLLLFLRGAAFNAFDHELNERARETLQELRQLGSSWTDEQLGEIALQRSSDTYFDRFMLTVYNAEGTVIASSEPKSSRFDSTVEIQSHELNPDETRYSTVPAAGALPEVRGVLRPFSGRDGQAYLLWVASPLTHATDSVQTARNVLLWTLPINIFAATVAGWYLAGIAIAPIGKVRRVAEELSPESMNRQIDLESPHIEVAALQDELNQARRRIHEGYEAQERFILNVSHELKTPIAVLLTEAQVLQSQPGLSHTAQSFIHSVEEEMHRLGKLTESFLLLAQIQSGKREPRDEVCPLNDIVLDSVQACASLADQTGVHLKVVLFEHPQASELTVTGDSALFRTMFDNLIRNAIRFSPCGETVEVTVGADPESSQAMISVRDHGPGVPPEVVDRLFDRFVQAEGERKRRRGTGLGLEIAQGIARQHGGTITVCNGENRGCIFTAAVPALGIDGL